MRKKAFCAFNNNLNRKVSRRKDLILLRNRLLGLFDDLGKDYSGFWARIYVRLIFLRKIFGVSKKKCNFVCESNLK